jgi:folylpolyglutamate synthase/dihydropteroate synthase
MLAERWRALVPDGAAEATASPDAAIERALGDAAGPVLVAGSLFLVGEVRARLVDDPALRDG